MKIIQTKLEVKAQVDQIKLQYLGGAIKEALLVDREKGWSRFVKGSGKAAKLINFCFSNTPSQSGWVGVSAKYGGGGDE